MKRDKLKAEHEVHKAQEREETSTIELEEVQREVKSLQDEYESLQKAKEDKLRPRLAGLNKEIVELQGEIDRHSVMYEKMKQDRSDAVNRIELLRQEKQVLEHDIVVAKQQHAKIKTEPDKYAKMAEALQSQLAAAESESARYSAEVSSLDGNFDMLEKQCKQLEDQRLRLATQLTKQRAALDQKESGVAELKRTTQHTRARADDLMAERVKLELDVGDKTDQVRDEQESMNRYVKMKDADLLELRRRQLQLAEAEKELPALTSQIGELQREIGTFDVEMRTLQHKKSDLQRDVDVNLHQCIVQDTMTQKQVEEVELAAKEVKGLEAQVQELYVDEQKLSREVANAAGAREVQAREANEARQKHADLQQQIKIKKLQKRDLKKRRRELKQRLKEFSALYEMLKNERGKFATLKQLSLQAAAEMKEKLKIRENELDILRSESETRDKAQIKEKFEFQFTTKERDELRHNANKLSAELDGKRALEEQNVGEIAKLNGIINSAEEELLRLKRSFERAVQQRNYVGIQLIDRNDELCILYEKSNVQESRLRTAEIEYRQREQDARLLNLAAAESEREIAIQRKLLPKVPELENQILSMMLQLQEERSDVKQMCLALEDPSNMGRYKQLGGEDPTPEELTQRLAVLEGRFNQKEEQLLEKKLLLDQVTQLTDAARREALEGRQGTRNRVLQVNEFQAKIKALTRKMMATVSELSMYQATAMKMEQEKLELEATLDQARVRLEAGEPPTDDAEANWFRILRDRQRLEEDTLARQRTMEGEQAGEVPGAVVSTAQVRPNAYIPDDGIGIPKPYGSHPPLKPTEAGSTMRHIRKPVLQEIQI
eukprot:TRINITY_DN11581_c0_g1_i1.p1 TRINITY_DN11581_c0_g1~~TRINITY_DN11581_c0_g1_i1.p1  ORF type:complete len:959 (+),score=296.70 TRINITY_DN11581_c0_g1_i1:377-2878(+)